MLWELGFFNLVRTLLSIGLPLECFVCFAGQSHRLIPGRTGRIPCGLSVLPIRACLRGLVDRNDSADNSGKSCDSGNHETDYVHACKHTCLPQLRYFTSLIWLIQSRAPHARILCRIHRARISASRNLRDARQRARHFGALGSSTFLMSCYFVSYAAVRLAVINQHCET